MKRSLFVLLLALLIIPMAVDAQGYPPAVDAALEDVNARLGTSYSLNQLVNWYWEERTFPDASMGCPLRGTEYAQVETPGFVIVLTIHNQSFEYRALIGSRSIVFCSARPAPAPASAPPEASEAPVLPPGNWEYTATGGNFNPYLAWSPSGESIAVSGVIEESGAASGMILLYDPDDLALSPTQIPLDQPVTALEYIATDPVIYLVTGGGMGDVAIFPVEPQGVDMLTMQAEAFDSTVTAVAISPDRQFIASANATENDPALSDLYAIHLWNASTGELIHNLEAPAPITSLDFSPDGAWLVAGTVEGTAAIYSYQESSTPNVFGTVAENSASVITVVRFSPNGSLLAVASEFTITVWDVTDPQNRIITQIFTTDAPLRTLDFSPDNTFLAAAGGDPSSPNVPSSVIRLWDVTTGENIATLRAHTDAVNSIAFSPEGTRLASVSYDGTLRVWEFGAVLG